MSRIYKSANQIGKKTAQRITLAKEGKCPFCGDSNTDYGPVTVDAGCAYQQADCISCEKQWSENYVLSFIEELK